MIVRFTEDAEGDLESIGDHIARDNPSRALSFVRELRVKCMSLAVLPSGFPLVARYERHAVRRRAHGDYLIFYRVEAENVMILHIWHGAMDYLGILFLPTADADRQQAPATSRRAFSATAFDTTAL